MKPFSLLVKPASADCNLRCDYCFYLDHASFYPETTVHKMSDKTLENMIKTFMSIDQRQYAFGWQGGEPTILGLDFFRRVVELQQKYGRGGAVVANGLQTNATLIDKDFAEHLAKYRFLLGVSMDGPPEIHDLHRKNAAGEGSHARVLRGIEHLRNANVEFNILILVSDSNAGHAREVYQYLCENGFLFHQYIPCVEFDADGKLHPFSITGKQWGAFMCEIYDQWIGRDERRVSIRLFDSILNRLVMGTTNICHMGKDCRQYFVVEYNGDVFPCDFFVEKDLKLGNAASDRFEDMTKSELYEEFGSRKAKWNDACDGCEHLRLCAGDCLKHRFQSAVDPGMMSSLCAGWKMFYDHAREGFEDLAKNLRREHGFEGPKRVGPVSHAPRKNAPCPCGSGKKYKNCCGKKK
jgi:uncharacterized protein